MLIPATLRGGIYKVSKANKVYKVGLCPLLTLQTFNF